MQITLFQRTYSVDGAPVTLSLGPFATSQRYTFPVGERVYKATYSEIRIDAPDGTRVEPLWGWVVWAGDKGLVSSTAQEVYDLAHAGNSGFRLAK